MLISWLIALLPILIAAALQAWVVQVKEPTLRWKRFACIVVALTFPTCVLAIYWLPPPGALADLATAGRAGTATVAVDLTCRQASEGASLLKRMTNDQIQFREPNSLLVSADLWKAMALEQRERLRNLAQRHGQCINRTDGLIELLDLQSEQPL